MEVIAEYENNEINGNEDNSPDKVQNNPSDEVGENLVPVTDDFHVFQSDVDLEAIETIANNRNWRKVVPRVEPNIDCQRNLIVHASGEDVEIKSSLKTFLEDISLGHLLTIFEEEDVSLEIITHIIVVRKNYFPGLSQPRPWLAEIYLILILLQICYIFRIVYKSLVTPVTRY